MNDDALQHCVWLDTAEELCCFGNWYIYCVHLQLIKLPITWYKDLCILCSFYLFNLLMLYSTSAEGL